MPCTAAISTSRWCACCGRIGYDVRFCRGTGQYLFDAAGARYLDLLSGFGVFAIGRNHPALRDALKSVLDSDLPNLVQLDVSTLAGILAERLLALRALSRQGVLRQFRRRGGRGRDQVRARRDRTAGPRLSASMPSTACPTARCRSTATRCSATASSRCCPIAFACRSTISPRSSGAVVAQDRGLHRRADPGQGRQPARRRLSAGGRRALPPARHAVRRRRNPDRARPHRPLPRGRALERRAGHGAAVEVAVRRPRAESAPC